jgi:hypothetical protein
MADDGEMLQRVGPCVSIPAWSRSGAHATKCELFTFPWGSPREAEIEPKSSIKAKLGAFRRRRNYSSVVGVQSREVRNELLFLLGRSYGMFQRGAVPFAMDRGGLVSALAKVQQGGFGVCGRAHVIV